MTSSRAHNRAVSQGKGSKVHSNAKDLQETLLDLLSIGRLVITPQWNYLAGDWVTSICAADIDDDSDIEIVVGSRDGYVRVLTRQGTLRWQTSVDRNCWITSVAIIPSVKLPAETLLQDDVVDDLFTVPDAKIVNKAQPRIIASTRDGRVYALDAQGNKIVNWSYQTEKNQVISQIYVHPAHPDEVIVGGEDRYISLLKSSTGERIWRHAIEGRVLCVYAADVDNDGEQEILASASDRCIYVLNRDGERKSTIKLNYKSYVLAATEHEQDVVQCNPESLLVMKDQPPIIFASYEGKDLQGWTLANPPQLSSTTGNSKSFLKTWPPRSYHASTQQTSTTFQGRPQVIHIADINGDNLPEILIGSADHFLYILDHLGQFLWKYDCKHSVYSIYVCDYDNDGISEVIIGLGDNNVRSLKIELAPNNTLTFQVRPDTLQGQKDRQVEPDLQPSLYRQIQLTMQKVRRQQGGKNPLILGEHLIELANNLGLLQDQEPKIEKRELSLAYYKLKLGEYKKALAIFLRLREQGVQHYWERPLTNMGHIRDLVFGDVLGNPIDEIIIGTDERKLAAIDINNEKEGLWEPRPTLASSVVALQTGNPYAEGHESTFVVLENRSFCLVDNNGKQLPLPANVLEEEDRVSALSVIDDCIEGIHKIKNVVIGLENQKIYVYDALLRKRLAVIETAQSVKVLCAYDMTGHSRVDILVGTSDYAVCLYEQDEQDLSRYEQLWKYQTGDRIRALQVADIDGDGQPEVIIGSEDRNLYILNHAGHLMWRYFMPDSVMSVDAYDINSDKQCEVLAGVADGFIYIFNAQGDLCKKLSVGDRVRVVRAKNLHPEYYSNYADEYVEIAVATDDRLMLLQILHSDKINAAIEECWLYLRNNTDYREILYNYADHRKEKNEYIRAFALRRLAGQSSHRSEDFSVLQRSVTEDPSPIVSQALANAVVNLFLTTRTECKNVQLPRQLLYRLARKPSLETRIAIVYMLDELAKIDPVSSFDYLEGFLGNVDLWLRRMVIRQLYNLAPLYRKEVFRLLQIGSRDTHPWIRQETGRSLAHYFDCYTSTLFSDLHELLGDGIDPIVTEQIAVSAEKPVIKSLFVALTVFLRAFQRDQGMFQDISIDSLHKRETADAFNECKKQYEANLSALLSAIQIAMETIPQAEDTLVAYQELQNLLRVKTTADIEQFHRVTSSQELRAFRYFCYIDDIINDLLKLVEDIKLYRRREALSDKAATLIEATSTLSRIRNQHIGARHQVWYSAHSSSQELLPEDMLIRIILLQWYMILRKELRYLRGTADLSIESTPDDVQREETVELFFQLTNKGSSAADNVRVILLESDDYEIIGSRERLLEQISWQHPMTIGFTLKPRVDSFRIETDVTYNDAEHECHFFKQGHRIELKKSHLEFEAIPNFYHGGTPTSDEKMFFGRQEDLQLLCEKLSSTMTTANHVVLLVGQRRSGKTSLIYQLKNRLNPHVPVHIDLQSFAMSHNTAELFSKIALAIHETLEVRGLAGPDIREQDFSANPTQTFERYLERAIQQLEGLRLVLLIDEFEVFNQLIKDQRLDSNFLSYLRSLMQHRLGINFLLAGAPRVLLEDVNNRSAFLNIAQHHRITRLKREDAERLIVDPVRGCLTYDPIALERIHNLTGDQPYLIHLLCEVLISNCNQRRKSYANTNDVNNALDTVLERGQNYFGFIWKLAASSNERFLLSLMAQDTNERQGRAFSLADLQEAFSDLDLPYQSEQIRAALNHLEQEEIVEEDSGGHLFTLPVGLTRAWLRVHQSIERVTREEYIALLEGNH